MNKQVPDEIYNTLLDAVSDEYTNARREGGAVP